MLHIQHLASALGLCASLSCPTVDSVLFSEHGEARNEKSLLGLQRVNIACPSHSSNQIVTISVRLPSDSNFYGNSSFIPSPPSSEYLSNVGGLLFQCADINRVVWGTKSFQTVGW